MSTSTGEKPDKSERPSVSLRIGPSEDLPGRSRFKVQLIGGIALIGIVVAGMFAYLHRAVDAETAAADEARDVAVDRIARLLSYTPTTARSDLESEVNWLGGDFRSEYSELVSSTIAPAAEQAKITVAAKVVGAGVELVQDDQVSVLLFVNVDTTSESVKTPQLTGSRVEVLLEKDGGDWLITKFTPLEGVSFAP